MTYTPPSFSGRLGISGALEFKDATGAVIKTVGFRMRVPIDQLGLDAEQASALVASANELPQQDKGKHDGNLGK